MRRRWAPGHPIESHRHQATTSVSGWNLMLSAGKTMAGAPNGGERRHPPGLGDRETKAPGTLSSPPRGDGSAGRPRGGLRHGPRLPVVTPDPAIKIRSPSTHTSTERRAPASWPARTQTRVPHVQGARDSRPVSGTADGSRAQGEGRARTSQRRQVGRDPSAHPQWALPCFPGDAIPEASRGSWDGHPHGEGPRRLAVMCAQCPSPLVLRQVPYSQWVDADLFTCARVRRFATPLRHLCDTSAARLSQLVVHACTASVVRERHDRRPLDRQRPRETPRQRIDGHVRRLVQRIAIDTGADRRERDVVRPRLVGQPERVRYADARSAASPPRRRRRARPAPPP